VKRASSFMGVEKNTSNAARVTSSGFTNDPVVPGTLINAQIEFGRARDVQTISGIKRGLLHLLVSEGKIKSVFIRRKGNVHGTRYYSIPSVLAYMHSLMDAQNGGNHE